MREASKYILCTKLVLYMGGGMKVSRRGSTCAARLRQGLLLMLNLNHTAQPIFVMHISEHEVAAECRAVSSINGAWAISGCCLPSVDMQSQHQQSRAVAW